MRCHVRLPSYFLHQFVVSLMPILLRSYRAASILYELFETYTSRGAAVFIAHLRPEPQVTFARAGIVELLGENAFFGDVASAIAQVEQVEMAPRSVL